MTIRPPRIGPISGVLNAPINIPPPPVPLCVFPNGLSNPSTVVPRTCGDIGPAMPIIGDSGQIQSFGTLSVTPVDPLFTAGIALGVVICVEGSGFVDYVPSNVGTLPAPYTTIPTWIQATGVHSIGACGYQAFSGGPPGVFTGDNFTASGGAPFQRLMVVAFPTHAIAPLQSGFQNGTGFSAFLPNPITPGSLIVIVSYGETAGLVAPPGINTRVNINFPGVGVGTPNMQIGDRCGILNENQNIPVYSSSFSHWSWVTEWLIT